MTDDRVRVTEPFWEAYQRYLDDRDNRVTKALKPISFEEFLWKEAERGGDRVNKDIENIKGTINFIKERKYLENFPHLANFMLRDLKVVKDAGLSDLSWAMHKEDCSKEDVLGLIEHIEKYIKEQEEADHETLT